MTPLCTRICPYSFFEATPPGAAPGPPVKTGARVRRFRGCKKDIDGPAGVLNCIDQKEATSMSGVNLSAEV